MSNQFTLNISQINLDDYEIKQFIRRGGFSFVCKAIDKKTRKEVAIKPYIVEDKDLSFYIRGVNVSCSDIPCLVKTIGYRFPLTEEERQKSKYLKINVPGYDKPIDFTGFIVVMNYYKMNDLSTIMNDYLKSNGSQHDLINPTIRSKIIFGVSSIMKQFHAKNAIYRDLKIENIFLNDELEPIIADFELSKFIIDPLVMTMAIGTPYIIAPEVYTDETYSYPADVFSYGFLLYRMFRTNINFADKKPIRSVNRYMLKILNGDRPVRPENIPDHYWELIQRCWKEDPEERPTFEEITELLKKCT